MMKCGNDPCTLYDLGPDLTALTGFLQIPLVLQLPLFTLLKRGYETNENNETYGTDPVFHLLRGPSGSSDTENRFVMNPLPHTSPPISEGNHEVELISQPKA